MKVSAIMNAIPRYTGHHWLDDLRFLAEQSYQSRTLPFAFHTPFPANCGLVRNQSEGGINTQKIELQAACLGIDRLAWLFGADAEYIGLTLKNDEPETAYLTSDQGSFNPVLLLAKIKGRNPDPLDAQYAYFIGQFTDSSIVHCAASLNRELTGSKESGDESVQKRRSRMARNILYALQDYDSGLSRGDSKVQALKNIRENSRQGTAGFTKARFAYQSHTRSLSQAAKTIFNRIRTYIEKQETGTEPLPGDNPGSPETIYAAFRPFLQNPSFLSKVWFDARAFTRSLMANQFGPEILSPLKGEIHSRKETRHDR
jgi:hypothetical protein